MFLSAHRCSLSRGQNRIQSVRWRGLRTSSKSYVYIIPRSLLLFNACSHLGDHGVHALESISPFSPKSLCFASSTSSGPLCLDISLGRGGRAVIYFPSHLAELDRDPKCYSQGLNFKCWKPGWNRLSASQNFLLNQIQQPKSARNKRRSKTKQRDCVRRCLKKKARATLGALFVVFCVRL